MKSLILEEGKLKLKELDIPKVGEGEILVKMRSCGICGTDIEKIKGFSLTNVKLGHEVTGDIVEVGPGVKNLKIGDKVFVHHHVACGECYYCVRGSETLCDLFLTTNIEPCGFSEYFKVPKVNVEKGGVIKLEGIDYEEGTFIEPLACCIRNLKKCEFKEGERVMVIGCGVMGLLHILLLKELGASSIYALDLLSFRLNKAKEFGANHTFYPSEEFKDLKVDLAIVATGNKKAFLQALNFLRKGGRISLFGAPFKGSFVELDLSHIFINEIKIIPSYSASEKEIELAYKIIKDKKIKVKNLITHRFSINDYLEAFQLAEKGEESLKVIIVNP